ncbi:MAG: hypothetical protein ACYDC2_06035 [Solirubrobacteraceae bacterium]
MALVLCVLAATPASALPSATGDPHGVGLARSVSAAFARVHAVSYEQSGFAWMRSEHGARPVFAWRWGGGPAAGMVPVREHAVMGLQAGLVRWWRDDLTPLPCTGVTPCAAAPAAAAAQVSAVIVVTAGGAFYAYGSHERHTCFGRLGGSTPQRIGEPSWSAFGEFQRPAEHGELELLKSSYPWNLTGGTADEMASLSVRTHLPVRQQTTIVPPAGGGAGAFTFIASFGYPAHASSPTANVCHA